MLVYTNLSVIHYETSSLNTSFAPSLMMQIQSYCDVSQGSYCSSLSAKQQARGFTNSKSGFDIDRDQALNLWHWMLMFCQRVRGDKCFNEPTILIPDCKTNISLTQGVQSRCSSFSHIKHLFQVSGLVLTFMIS